MPFMLWSKKKKTLLFFNNLHSLWEERRRISAKLLKFLYGIQLNKVYEHPHKLTKLLSTIKNYWRSNNGAKLNITEIKETIFRSAWWHQGIFYLLPCINHIHCFHPPPPPTTHHCGNTSGPLMLYVNNCVALSLSIHWSFGSLFLIGLFAKQANQLCSSKTDIPMYESTCDEWLYHLTSTALQFSDFSIFTPQRE